MGLTEYYAMSREWASRPPVHLMVAAYLGIEPNDPEPEHQIDTAEGLLQWAQSMGMRVTRG